MNPRWNHIERTHLLPKEVEGIRVDPSGTGNRPVVHETTDHHNRSLTLPTMERKHPMINADTQKRQSARILQWALALLILFAGQGLMAQKPAQRPMVAPLDPGVTVPAKQPAVPAQKAVQARPEELGVEAPVVKEIPMPPVLRGEALQLDEHNPATARPREGQATGKEERQTGQTPRPQAVRP